MDTELLVDRVQVRLDRSLSDRELESDFLVPQTGRDHLDDLRLAFRQDLGDLLCLFALSEAVEGSGHERRLESSFATLNAANGLDETNRGATIVPAFVVVALGVNATSALVISQVILSIALPLPMIALIIFTGRRDIMGAFVDSRLTRVVALGGTVVVLALNGVLIAQTLL